MAFRHGPASEANDEGSHALELQTASSRSYSYTLGPNLGPRLHFYTWSYTAGLQTHRPEWDDTDNNSFRRGGRLG